MCGINISFGQDEVRRMNECLSHRGIRGKEVEVFPGVILGHVRLPIQGLGEEFDQPMQMDNLVGAFVGEVFNFRQFDPEAQTDLPVIMDQLCKFGTSALKKFDGFFSITVIDRTAKLIHLYTDFLSKKPLYRRVDKLGVSSEITPLLELGPTTPNETYFAAVRKWGYSPNLETPHREIVQISPGTHMVLDEKGIVQFTGVYDRLRPDNQNVHNALVRSVKNRMVSDVPISLLMSGGLDSTIIYYIMRELTEEINIFHVDNDEAEYLDYIDFRPGDKIHTVSLTDQEYNLEDIIWHNNCPVDLGSMIPQMLLSREIHKHDFKVCLSGDGADELFGGYKRAMEYDSQASDINHELVHYHLPRLDRMMMANTVELRCPFLSRDVIQAAMALPWASRTCKQVLKEAFRGIVPGEILGRVKKPLRFQGKKKFGEHIELFKEMTWR